MALTKVSAAMFSTAAQTSDLNLDDGTLFVDSSENKVAIGNTAPAEALDITGNLTLRSRGYVKLQDASGGQFVALRAPATVSSNVTWSLPAADGSSGQSLVTDGSGALSWQTNYLSVSAGTGVTVSSNTISIGQAVATSDSPTFTNLTLSGNLTVNGSTVTNSATNTTIEDLLIELGTGTSGSPSSDAGIVIERGSSDNVFMGWDESADVIVLGTGSFTGASSGNLTITPATLHVGSIGIGNAAPDVSLDIGSKTDAVHLPVGTTAQRPGSPAAGYFRYNSTLSKFEGYTTAWGEIGGGGSNSIVTDTFTGNGSTVDFTLSSAMGSVNNLIVFIDGVYQNPDAYSLPAATTLRFSAAPANSRKIVAYGITGVVTGSNLNIDSFTGDGSDLTFTLSITPVNENNTLVYVGGVYQQKSVYSVSGTTLTFGSGNAPPNGASIEVATFNQTDINVPVDNTITTAKIVDDAVTAAKLASNAVVTASIVDDNVTTAKIADNAVTLAKMAGIARGKIIYGDASGNPAVLTAGGAGTVLTSDGTDISWAEEVATNYLPLAGGTLTGNIAHASNFTIDVGGSIILDADSGDFYFKDGGTTKGFISTGNNNFGMTSSISDDDIVFTGNDGGSSITALRLDMSEAGAAHFNSRVGIGVAPHATAALNITSTNQNIRLNNGSELGIIDLDSDGDLIFWAHGSENIKFVNGTGTGDTRITIDSSGHVLPGANNTQSLGSSSARYYQVWAGTNMISPTYIATGNVAAGGYQLTDTSGNGKPALTSDANNWTILRPLVSGGDVAVNNFANTHNRVVFRDEGDVQIGDGNLIFASGHGIDFGATAGPTHTGAGSSELLNDYEQGTWTPTIESYQGNSVNTGGTFSGYYVKIGQQVTVTFTGNNFTFSGSHGTDLVGVTLPFNPTAGIEGGGGCAFHGLSSGGMHLMPLIISSGNALVGFIGSNNNNGSWGWTTFNHVGSGNTSFRAQFTYFL